MSAPRVLVACERSGTIRNAFGAAGFDVTSVDTLESTSENVGMSRHIVADALELINYGRGWDLVIARPPCTYLANSGARWLYSGRDDDGELVREPIRWQNMVEGAAFFNAMLQANATRVAVENPVPHRAAAERIGKPTQYVQPYEYGHPESKKTGLWLYNLPPLEPTDNVKAEMDALPKAEAHRVHHLPPGPDRWMKRSLLVQGIADAMVAQWGGLL